MLDIFQEIRILKEKISNLASNSIGNSVPQDLSGYLQSSDVTVTKQGNTFNGNSQLVKSDTNGKLPAIDGSLLINLSVIQTADYVISKSGSNITATPKAGSGLTSYSGTDAYTVIQSAINALIIIGGGTTGSAGGKIYVSKEQYFLSNELTINGWENTVSPYSQLIIEGSGGSTYFVQNTPGKNAFVTKNGAVVSFKNFRVYTGTTAKSGWIADSNGSNSEIGCYKSSVDNVIFYSNSTSSPAVYLKNIFDLNVGTWHIENDSNHALVIENDSTSTNYGNSNFGYTKCISSTSNPFAGILFRTTSPNHFPNLCIFNYYQCQIGNYGIYSDCARSITFGLVDIETTGKSLYFTGDTNGRASINNKVKGYLLCTNNKAAITCDLNTGGNDFDVYIDGDSTTIPTIDTNYYSHPNSYSFNLGLIAMVANMSIGRPDETPLTYKIGGSFYIYQKLPTGTEIKTLTAGDNSNKITNSAFVKSAIDTAIAGVSTSTTNVGASLFKAFHDFTSTSINENITSVFNGTGATPTVIANPSISELGVVQGALGTVATNRAGYASNNFNTIRLGGGLATYTAKLKIITLSDDINTYTVRQGFITNVAIENANVVGFRYTHNVNAGKWEAYCGNGSVYTIVDTGVVVSTSAFATYKIIVNANASSVTFFINGILVATIATNIPTGVGKELGYGFTFQRSVGTAAITGFQADFLDITYAFTTSR